MIQTNFESTAKTSSAVLLTKRQQSLSVLENIPVYTKLKAQKCQVSHLWTAPWHCKSQTSASPWNILSLWDANFLVWGDTSDIMWLFGSTSVHAHTVSPKLTSESWTTGSAMRRHGVDATEAFLQLNEANSRKKECVSFSPPKKLSSNFNVQTIQILRIFFPALKKKMYKIEQVCSV